MSTGTGTGTGRLRISLPASWVRALEERRARSRGSMSDVLRSAIAAHVDRLPPDPGDQVSIQVRGVPEELLASLRMAGPTLSAAAKRAIELELFGDPRKK